MRALRLAFAPSVFCLLTLLAPAGRETSVFAADRNACGCYEDNGKCVCDKKSKCGCPGECEPVGCDEKRQKQIDKEVEVEMKRAQKSARPAGKNAGSSETVESAPSPPRKLTATQRRDLAKLLELYLAAEPDASNKTVEQAARELAAPTK